MIHLAHHPIPATSIMRILQSDQILFRKLRLFIHQIDPVFGFDVQLLNRFVRVHVARSGDGDKVRVGSKLFEGNGIGPATLFVLVEVQREERRGAQRSTCRWICAIFFEVGDDVGEFEDGAL